MRVNIAALAAASFVLAGCAQPHQIRDRSDYLVEATRTFPGETRERVLKAAETVLRVSDPSDFEFRYSLNGFTGLRRYFVYAVLASQTGREKWDFLAEQTPTGIQASVSISEAGVTSGGYSSTPFERSMASVPLYRLFWNRVEYILGKRSEWTTCDEAQQELERTKTNTAEGIGGLCGSTSQGRDALAPPQMPALRVIEDTPRSPPPKRKKQG